MTSYSSSGAVLTALRQVALSVQDAVRVIVAEFIRHRDAGRPSRVINSAEITHRDVVVGNATIGLDPDQISAIQELQQEAGTGHIAHAAQ